MHYCDEKIMAMATGYQRPFLSRPESLRHENASEGGEGKRADNDESKARQRPGECGASPAT
jgi:hypothetical protein